jgi:hypothetical protein
MLIKRAGEGRQDKSCGNGSLKIQTLKAPGLCPVKQVDFYKKFCPFLPREFWEDTCPIPSDEVLAQVKDESSKKQKTKVPGEKSAPKKRV